MASCGARSDGYVEQRNPRPPNSARAFLLLPISCRDKGRKLGINFDRAREAISSSKSSLEAPPPASIGRTAVRTFWRISSAIPKFSPWEDDSANDSMRETYRIHSKVNSSTRICNLRLAYRTATLPAPCSVRGSDYSGKLSKYSDFLEDGMSHNCAGPAWPLHRRHHKRRIGDVPKRELREFSYRC